jgi:hypothetical protein
MLGNTLLRTLQLLLPCRCLLSCQQAHLSGDAHAQAACSPVTAVAGSQLRAAAVLVRVVLLMFTRRAAAHVRRLRANCCRIDTAVHAAA